MQTTPWNLMISLQKKRKDKDLPEVSGCFVWFRELKAEVIKQGMLKDARISAGLAVSPMLANR